MRKTNPSLIPKIDAGFRPRVS